jgi:hypothetical protein
MKNNTGRILFWTPRILVFLFAIFVSLFALDVFGEGRGFWETVLALLIHLIPTAIILIALVISWRWELIGGILFIGLGLWYILESGGKAPWSVYALMAGVPFLVGVLFLVNWRYKSSLRARI